MSFKKSAVTSMSKNNMKSKHSGRQHPHKGLPWLFLFLPQLVFMLQIDVDCKGHAVHTFPPHGSERSPV